MKISYLVTCKDEIKEIKKLIPYLLSLKEDEDEIVVLQDYTNLDKEVAKYLLGTDTMNNTKSLNNDFATFKNYGKSKCVGDYVFQIDADEIPSEYFIKNIKTILSMNEDVELFWVPRINIVKGLTDEWVNKWGWRLTKMDEFKNPLINWPDPQSRLFRNTKKIQWTGRIHEVVVNAEKSTRLPAEIEYAIYHEKTLKKQISQNEYYSRIK